MNSRSRRSQVRLLPFFMCLSLVSPSLKMKLTLNTYLLCWHFRPRRSKIAAPLGHTTDLSQDALAYFLSHIVWRVRNWDLNLQWIHWLYKRCVAALPHTAKSALTEEHRNGNLPMHPVTVVTEQYRLGGYWQCHGGRFTAMQSDSAGCLCKPLQPLYNQHCTLRS